MIKKKKRADNRNANRDHSLFFFSSQLNIKTDVFVIRNNWPIIRGLTKMRSVYKLNSERVNSNVLSQILLLLLYFSLRTDAVRLKTGAG